MKDVLFGSPKLERGRKNSRSINLTYIIMTMFMCKSISIPMTFAIILKILSYRLPLKFYKWIKIFYIQTHPLINVVINFMASYLVWFVRKIFSFTFSYSTKLTLTATNNFLVQKWKSLLWYFDHNKLLYFIIKHCCLFSSSKTFCIKYL